MKPLPMHVWREFQLAVMSLADDASQKKVLRVIIEWIRNNNKYFIYEPFSSYGISEFSSVNEDLMPVEFSSFLNSDVGKFKKVISEYKAKDVDFIARFLRDTMEMLLTIEVDRKCSRCQSRGMRVFIGKNNGLLAYQCNACGHSNYSDGSVVEDGGLDFVSEKKLRELNII